jgi:protein arginine kinase activator
MKCQKCAKQAVVHLTEIVSPSQAAQIGSGVAELGGKHAVEIHLCLMHAVEAGLLTPVNNPSAPPQTPAEQASSSAIMPASSEPAELAVARTPVDPLTCPICGSTWAQFKQGGLMGCAHDYEQFAGKLVPLLKRAQEGATEHVGKVPAGRKTQEADRQVATLRLRRELQKAIDAENYEQAARLRDQLKSLEHN